ncbi:MAG: hypothetical protein IPL47_16350 [Phyllobacteriaceae bacterium]|nr:hypothetical protein [Phyllobacteriaceae bacterium]
MVVLLADRLFVAPGGRCRDVAIAGRMARTPSVAICIRPAVGVFGYPGTREKSPAVSPTRRPQHAERIQRITKLQSSIADFSGVRIQKSKYTIKKEQKSSDFCSR